MDDQSKTVISIIGLGLIGGSIAKSLRRSGHKFEINAFDRKEVLDLALQDNNIDKALLSPEESVSSDIIFLCLPVQFSLDVFVQLTPVLKKGTIITDVCGIKGVFELKLSDVKTEGIYIGGHPMTGKEKGGYQNSDPLLFENSVYIISQRAKKYRQSHKLISVIELLGARIIFLDPFLHDRVVANVSHIPQLLSVALVNNASKESNGVNNIDFAAGGFRDMTRIASSDFNIWESVFQFNKIEILKALSSLQKELEEIKACLESDNSGGLQSFFETARIKRDSIPKNTKGFMHPLYDVFVYVSDKPGIISIISTSLFQKNINIKDIELLKIREGTGGTFRLAFENGGDAEKARETLNEIGFTTF